VPIGTPVDVTGASKPGTLVYDSWLTMQADRERDARPVSSTTSPWSGSNPADVPNVNPTCPASAVPRGSARSAAWARRSTPTANSELRGGVTKPSPKRGAIFENTGGGRSHGAYTLTSGIPATRGAASGTARAGRSSSFRASTSPHPGGHGVGDLGNEIAYMDAHSPFGAVDLVPGTEPFNPNLVGAILGG
jgi:hypothetical protein